MMRVKKYPAILFFSLSILWAVPFHPVVSTASLLTIDEERILGEKFLQEVRKQFTLTDDDFTTAFINQLGQYLLKPVESRPFPFHFYIIKNGDMNAFAGPGGHIFVCTGLIEAMEKIDELASVISHEIAHVTARHLAHRMEQSKKIGLASMAGMLAGILIGGKAAGAVMTGSAAAGIQAQLYYSRNDERQADQMGFDYMEGSGFDPSGMITTLKKIQQNQWLGTDRVPPYLLTHPTGPERMSDLDVMMSQYIKRSTRGEAEGLRARFPYVKTIIKAKYDEPYEAEKAFRRDLQKNPNNPLAHFGLGMVWKEREEYTQALEHLEKAHQGEPESVLILQNLAETYQMRGQDDKAIQILEKALKLHEQDKQTLFLLATSYQNQEEHRKAIEIYERLSAGKPVKDEVFYRLGVSYGKLERLSLAHYSFGLYFTRVGSPEKAKFHFLKADELSRNDPVLKEKIRKALEEIRDLRNHPTLF